MPTIIEKNTRTTQALSADLKLMALARPKGETPTALKEGKETLKELLTRLNGGK